MNFSEALIEIKRGKSLHREGWNGRGMFVFLVSGSQFTVNRKPLAEMFPQGTIVNYKAHIDMKYADGGIGVWGPSIIDLMADDWEVLESIA